MKSRSNELLDKSIAAMISAIEIYNKPDFLYRGETFSILAINSWELLFKAKLLKDNHNKMRSLYVTEPIRNKDGSKSKRRRIKLTRSGNPFTHSIDYIAEKLIVTGKLDRTVWDNVNASKPPGSLLYSVFNIGKPPRIHNDRQKRFRISYC